MSSPTPAHFVRSLFKYLFEVLFRLLSGSPPATPIIISHFRPSRKQKAPFRKLKERPTLAHFVRTLQVVFWWIWPYASTFSMYLVIYKYFFDVFSPFMPPQKRYTINAWEILVFEGPDVPKDSNSQHFSAQTASLVYKQGGRTPLKWRKPLGPAFFRRKTAVLWINKEFCKEKRIFG